MKWMALWLMVSAGWILWINAIRGYDEYAELIAPLLMIFTALFLV